MNRFRVLVDLVQSAAHDALGAAPDSAEVRRLAEVEATLTAALPAHVPGNTAAMLQWAAMMYAAHVAVTKPQPGTQCACTGDCATERVLGDRRRAVLECGIAAGNLIAEVSYYRQSGAAVCKGLFIRGCGGPYSGNFLSPGSVKSDDPHAVRNGHRSNRTTDDVEASLLSQGWRVVNFDEAAAVLAAVGYALDGQCSRSALHVLRPGETGLGRWRAAAHDDRWTLRAIAVRV